MALLMALLCYGGVHGLADGLVALWRGTWPCCVMEGYMALLMALLCYGGVHGLAVWYRCK